MVLIMQKVLLKNYQNQKIQKLKHFLNRNYEMSILKAILFKELIISAQHVTEKNNKY